MGRELKRVPLNFAWPIKEIWGGYISPFHSVKCQACDAYGWEPRVLELERTFYDLDGGRANAWHDRLTQDEVDALVAEGRLYDLAQTFTPGKGWQPDPSKPHPTAEQVNAWARKPIGHDAINRGICIQARAKRLYGLEGNETRCKVCFGSGCLYAPRGRGVVCDRTKVKPEGLPRIVNDQVVLALASETWKWIEPPRGKGFQLWETTSEGSPISPVFATIEELCAWAADNAITFGSFTASAQEWRSMLDKNFVHHETVMPNGSKAVFL